MQEKSIMSRLCESADQLLDSAVPGSKTAAIVAGHRFDESQKPEDERICYNPYAVHFILPACGS